MFDFKFTKTSIILVAMLIFTAGETLQASGANSPNEDVSTSSQIRERDEQLRLENQRLKVEIERLELKRKKLNLEMEKQRLEIERLLQAQENSPE